MSLQEVDLQAVEDAVDAIDGIGFDVETVDGIEYDGSLRFTLAVRATTRHGSAVVVQQEPDEDGDEEDEPEGDIFEPQTEAEAEFHERMDEAAADPDVDEAEVYAEEIGAPGEPEACPFPRERVMEILRTATIGVDPAAAIPEDGPLNAVTLFRAEDADVDFVEDRKMVTIDGQESAEDTIWAAIDRWRAFVDGESIDPDEAEYVDDRRRDLEDVFDLDLPTLEVPETADDEVEASEDEIAYPVDEALPDSDHEGEESEDALEEAGAPEEQDAGDDGSLEERITEILDEHGELPSSEIQFYLETSGDYYLEVLASMQEDGRVESRQDPDVNRRNLYRLVDEDEDHEETDDESDPSDTDDQDQDEADDADTTLAIAQNLDLSTSEMAVIEALDDHGEATVADLADDVDVAPGTIHSYFNGFRELDLIESRDDPDDGRKKLYSLRGAALEDDEPDSPEPAEPVTSADEEDDVEETTERASPDEDVDVEYWCGFCGAGPSATETIVEDHHDEEGHPGEPVIVTEDPAEDVLKDGGPDVDDDRPPRDRVVDYLLEGCRDGDRYYRPEDVAMGTDLTGNETVEVLADLASQDGGLLDVERAGVSGSMWRVDLATPEGLTEGDVHAVVEACDSIADVAADWEVDPDRAATIVEAHGLVDELEDVQAAPEVAD